MKRIQNFSSGNILNYFAVLGIAVISGFSTVAEAWITPDLGRNVRESLPHSTLFLNGQSELLDFPSAIYRGALTTQPPSKQGI